MSLQLSTDVELAGIWGVVLYLSDFRDWYCATIVNDSQAAFRIVQSVDWWRSYTSVLSIQQSIWAMIAIAPTSVVPQRPTILHRGVTR